MERLIWRLITYIIFLLEQLNLVVLKMITDVSFMLKLTKITPL